MSRFDNLKKSKISQFEEKNKVQKLFVRCNMFIIISINITSYCPAVLPSSNKYTGGKIN